VSYARAEIAEQPAALTRLADRETASIERIAAALRSRPAQYVVIAARGSSDNAARYAQHVFGLLCGLPVALATPSLLTLYDAPLRLTGALVIGISQSGASPDVVRVIAEGAAQGCPTLAITNDPDSDLAHAAGEVIALHAGPERSVAATKTYTSSLFAIALLVAALATDEAAMAGVRAVPDAVARQLARGADAEALALAAAAWDRCAVVGRGANYATAFEAALKIKELTGIVAEPYSPADLMHGPIAVVRGGFPLLAFAPSGPTMEGMHELARAARARGASVAIASDLPDITAHGEPLLGLEPGPDWLSPLVAVVPTQILAVAIAERRGIDVDRPFGLEKVTLTN